MRVAWVVLVLGLVGCASPADSSVEGSWTLTAATDATGSLSLDPTHPVTLEIGEQTGGIAACNSYSATYEGDRFTQISQTEMGCEPASVMEIESRYLAALAATTAVEAGTRLTLTGPGIELTFTPTTAG